MRSFTVHEGVAAPLVRANIDTDAIIPSREMKRVSKEGLGEGLFANWRYSDPAKRIEDPDFILNREGYREATILIAGDNFGCGSSREHAVWALVDYGFRAIIAPSFGSIFYGNCVRNGILPIRIESEVVEQLATDTATRPESLVVDLPRQTVSTPAGSNHTFELSPAIRRCWSRAWTGSPPR